MHGAEDDWWIILSWIFLHEVGNLVEEEKQEMVVCWESEEQ